MQQKYQKLMEDLDKEHPNNTYNKDLDIDTVQLRVFEAELEHLKDRLAHYRKEES
jgi:hypothetical protein